MIGPKSGPISRRRRESPNGSLSLRTPSFVDFRRIKTAIGSGVLAALPAADVAASGSHLYFHKMLRQVLFGSMLIYAWALYTFIDRGVEESASVQLYVATVAPAVLFILFSIPCCIRFRYQKPAFALLIFLILTASCSLARADFATLISVGSLCAMLIAMRHSKASVGPRLINILFLLSIVTCATMHSLGIGQYGILPGQAVDESIPWRVSAALYFLIFSASRTGLIVLVLWIAFLASMKVVPFRERAFYKLFIPCAVASFVIALNAEGILVLLTDSRNPIANALLFKSTEGAASVEQASTSIERTMLWSAHAQIFMENPWIGRGTFKLEDVVPLAEASTTTGSESFMTALFARIGTPAVLFVYFIYLLAVNAARERDRFSYCLVIFFSVSSLAYGSYIVPYDFVFLAVFGAINYSRSACMPLRAFPLRAS
ncbi:MAG: hypothetical protein E6K40_14950 [Gammaproteobacteria bacterium]|nr:MAG: hypothetical protein E6K40_14950 [Gammaproteobacteria bacterium]